MIGGIRTCGGNYDLGVLYTNCRAFYVGIDTGFLQSFVVSLSVERSEFMPKNRIIPFSYCMKNGEIITEPKEVYAVVTNI